MSSPLVVLGGLFDPVHKGHVSAARFALEFLSVQRLKMIPCHLPNHKIVPATQAEHRLAMLTLDGRAAAAAAAAAVRVSATR